MPRDNKPRTATTFRAIANRLAKKWVAKYGWAATASRYDSVENVIRAAVMEALREERGRKP